MIASPTSQRRTVNATLWPSCRSKTLSGFGSSFIGPPWEEGRALGYRTAPYRKSGRPDARLRPDPEAGQPAANIIGAQAARHVSEHPPVGLDSGRLVAAQLLDAGHVHEQLVLIELAATQLGQARLECLQGLRERALGLPRIADPCAGERPQRARDSPGHRDLIRPPGTG